MSKQQNLQNNNENEIRERIEQKVRAAMNFIADPATNSHAVGTVDSAAGADPTVPTMALMPAYLFRPDRIAAWFKQQGFKPDCIRIGSVGADTLTFDHNRTIVADTPLQRQQLIAGLDRYRHILIITPALETISALADGDDSRFDILLAIRPLLWGRPVTMLLDFEPPRHRRAFARLADNLNTLDQMGVILHKLEDSGDPKLSGVKDLVTARDVEDASRQGKCITASHDAIITHLAVDTARDLGVTIKQQQSGG